ncbi:MAG: glutathione S-transferase family protein [Variibacter sp.]|nr:glutathione S-transferase family protein [Variibacter sp.]
MKLHYFEGSTTCRPIVMLAAEAGIPLELVPVDLMSGEHYGPAYSKLNPNNLVPLLEDGDFRLSEASAILKYIADVANSPAYPKDLKARARVNERMDWFNTAFLREFAYCNVYPQLFPHVAWPDAAVQAAVTQRGDEKARRLLGILNDHMLADPGPFLGGAAPDLSDYLGVCYVTLGEMIGHDFAAWPRVARWIAAMRGRPGWAKANAGFEGWRDAVRAKAAAS